MPVETKQALSALISNTSLQQSDCEPVSLPQPPSLRPVQRSVFQIESDWASSSTTAVLDAFHLSFGAQLSDASPQPLSFHRSAGSVQLHSSMADLLTQPNLPTSTSASRLVQCTNCNRPVLITRFLSHARLCNPSVVSQDPDPQYSIIFAPYQHSSLSANLPSIPLSQPAPMPLTPPAQHPRPSKNHSPMSCAPPDNSEHDDWEERLTSLIPSYIPRCASSRKRRFAISFPAESPTHRRKSIAIEKKAIIAARSMGISPLIPARTSSGHADTSNEPLSKAVSKWSSGVPWSKLMQIAMPLSVPRNPERKHPSKDSAPTSPVASAIYLTGMLPPSNSQAKQPRYMEPSDKQNPASQAPTPSLLGALLYIRGQGMKHLSNSSLQYMDVPQVPIPPSNTIFHGQTYVAQLGSFETDPRMPSTIKMPLVNSIQQPAQSAQVPAGNSSGPKFSNSSDARARRSNAKSSAPSSANGSAQPPVQKKQRTSKQQQRTPVSAANPQHFVAPVVGKQVQLARKPAAGRASSVVTPPNVKPAVSVHDHHLRLPPHRNIAQATASRTMNAVANDAAAAAAKCIDTQQSLRQKEAYRPPGGGIPVAPGRDSSGQPIHTGLAMGNVLPVGPKVGISRGNNKSRIHSSPAVSSTSPGMRGAGGKLMKNQSPCHSSTRSAERSQTHGRHVMTNSYNPVLLAAAAAQAQAQAQVQAQTPGAAGRNALLRAGPGKAQMDFQHAIAQVASHGANPGLREDSTGSVRQGSAEIPIKGGALPVDKVTPQMSRQGIRGMSPHMTIKHGTPIQGAQLRGTGSHKNITRLGARPLARKDNRDIKHRAQELEQQFRRAEPMPMDGSGVKASSLSNGASFGKRGDHGLAAANVSQGSYSAALAAGSVQMGRSATALKNQTNLGLLHMAQAQQNQNLVAASANAPVAPAILQNMHNLRQMQGLPVVPGMPGAPHNNSVMGFLQASALSAAMPNNGMSAGMGGGMPAPMGAAIGANVMPQGLNSSVLCSDDEILQQLFPNQAGLGVNAPPPRHAQPVVSPGAQLAHAHQLPRSAALPPTAHAGIPPTPHAALVEIDRALGIGFEEKDLLD